MRQVERTRIRNQNIAKMRELLKKHDWFHQMSDDRRAFERGEAERKEIEAMASSDGTLRRMYNSMKKKMFGKKEE